MFRLLTAVTLLVALATGSKIAIQNTPTYLLQDLTETLTIRCSLLDTASANAVGKRAAGDLTETQYDVKSVTSIYVVRNSINEPVANLTSQSAAAIPLTDLKSLKVHGSLGKNHVSSPNSEHAFLEMQWDHPGKNQTGGYTCYINAVDSQGQSVIFSTSAEIDQEFPSSEDMLGYISQLIKTVDSLQKRIEILENNASQLKPPHAEEGMVECEDSDSWNRDPYGNNGRYVFHNVKFQKPYDKPPMVSLGIDLLDESSDAYLRIHTDIDNLTKDGFTVRCGTWADTYIFKVRVRWVSVVA
ncbi:agglutinin [Elysia marginata]|uniref:Agglutinin n=1 Tax=Elysia marginata TaxID=1093978 RepID=A0AAV4H477_9GAST|nr:agglutinin [Elysia marginata]